MTSSVPDVRRSPVHRRVRALAALAAVLVCVLAGQLVAAVPASAHAELVDSTPGNGQRLDQPPAQVVLRFTERVSVVQGAFRLIDAATGDELPLPGADDPPDGATVAFPLPADLPDGSYLVDWRVVSADSHPIGGSLSFGIGEDAAAVSDTASPSDAPWQVTAVRALGYAAYAAVAGALTVALLWRRGRGDRRLRRLRGAGIVLGVAASVLGLLLEGPYVAGVPVWRLLERDVMEHVAHGQFGTWMQLRVLLYLLVGGVLWVPGALEERSNRWLAAGAVVGLAATFPGTGHAAAAGNVLEPVADGVHALSAGVWAGGLLALLVLSVLRGPRPEAEVFARFSRVALACVLLLVGTGTLAAVAQLQGWADLLDTSYGQLLSVKLLLVAVVLGVAAVARRTVGAGASPWQPVRYEAVGTLLVLALTAVLGVTPPPSREPAPGGGASGPADAGRTTVVLDLGEDDPAELVVDGLTTDGSRLRLTVPGPARGPESVRAVSLRAELPEEGIAATDVPLTRTRDGWRGRATFAPPGEWDLTLTVERRDLTAVVSAGTVAVR